MTKDLIKSLLNEFFFFLIIIALTQELSHSLLNSRRHMKAINVVFCLH